MEEALIEIEKNPAQPAASVARLFGFRIAGDGLITFIVSIITGLCLGGIGFSTNVFMGLSGFILPPVLAALYIIKFVRNKPKFYLEFWLSEKLQFLNHFGKGNMGPHLKFKRTR